MTDDRRTSILKEIHDAVSPGRHCRHRGLAGGSLGLAAFLLEYSEMSGNDRIRDEGEDLLNSIIGSIAGLPAGLMHGRWGLIPVIARLVKRNIITLGEDYLLFLDKLYNTEFFIYNAVPVKTYQEDPLLTDAILLRDMERVHSGDISELVFRERILGFVEECDCLLSEDWGPLHHPSRLTSCQLSSMLEFLMDVRDRGLYPTKTREVLSNLSAHCESHVFDGSVHSLLLQRKLYGKEVIDHVKALGIKDMTGFLGEAGLYAWLYEDGTVLTDFMDDEVVSELEDAISDNACDVDDLICIGLGLLTESKRGNGRDSREIKGIGGYSCDGSAGIRQRTVNEAALDISIIDRNPCLDLSDLTFCIPVRIDSAERKRNLMTVLRFYSAITDARFIVLEAGFKPLASEAGEIRNTEYVFIEDNNRIFHRTRYINKMLGTCRTPFAAVWDTDAVIPVRQISEALNILKEGDCIMAYPYGGTFLMVSDYFSHKFSETVDIRILTEYAQHSSVVASYHSVGGAFVVDIERYRAIGAENERFTGWGPEDVERYRRLEILGKRPTRTQGSLFHMNHPRGLNSGDNDTATMTSTKSELFKVCAMEKDQLMEYISTWGP